MNEARRSGTVQIIDDDLLYRRLYYRSIRDDGSISPAAYTLPRTTKPDPEISVDLARLTTPARTLAAAEKPQLFGLGVLKASDVRNLGFIVRHQPTQKNYAHCIIEGAKTETDCDRLAEITQVHTPPPRKSGR